MVKIRRAQKTDEQPVLELLKKLDLYYPGLEFKDFWVAEQGRKIIGCVQLTDYKDFLFLSLLAVIPEERRKEIGRSIMDKVLKSVNKDIYLYTIIPKFFEKHGFGPVSPSLHLSILPSKEPYECEYCQPEKCVTMIRKTNAA
ncbi:GNAT family N-acetyltransferase [Candidatus Margulisiibacteriota bacterium]